MSNGLEKALFVAEKVAEFAAGLPAAGEVGGKDLENRDQKQSKEIDEAGRHGAFSAERNNELTQGYYNTEVNVEGLAPADPEKVRLVSEVVTQTPELSPYVWQGLSPEQRLSALSELEQNVASITLRPPCEVVVEEMDGMYGYQCGDKIALNKELLESGDFESMKQAISTTLHEGRHAYQNFNIEDCMVEPNHELVDSWRLNYDMGYEDGDTGIFDFAQMGLKRYLTQPVEVDARVFAQSVVGNVYA